MKPAAQKEIKAELKHQDREELLQIVLRLTRFKKENKELLTYILLYAENEEGFRQMIKAEMDEEFQEINRGSYFFIKKSMRKILRNVKKYSRYSGKKETEIELLIYYLGKMNKFTPSIRRDKVLLSLYERQLAFVEKQITKLHDDLQFDMNLELEKVVGDKT